MKNGNRITLFNIASTIVLQGLAFFSGPIFSSALGTANYGIAAVYLTWVQIASTVFSLQIAGAVAVARVNFPLKDQSKYQSSTLSLATLSFACFSVLTIIISIVLRPYFNVSLKMIIFGLIQSWGLSCVTFTNNKLTYEFKAGKNFILSVTTSALTIGLSIVLIHFYSAENNYWGRIIGQSSIYGIIGLVLFITIIRSGRTLFNKEYWKFALPITIPTIFHALAHIVLNQSDKVMIQSMVGNSAAGIYALASTFGAVMNAIWHAFNNSWVPFYYEYTRQDQIEKMKRHAKNYVELFTIVVIVFILLSREVFHIYAAQMDFWSGTDLIPLFAVGYYFVFVYSFPVNFEFYNKKTKMIAVGTTSSALINIVLNYIMIKWYGILGAVIATAIAHAFLFLFHYFSARHIKEMMFPFTLFEFVPGIVAVTIACILYMLTREIWVARWGVSIMLGLYLLIKIYRRKEIF